MADKKIWQTISVLSVFGMFLAIYLFYNYLTRPAFQPCSINATINCDAVTKGVVSTFFGIPVSLIGLIGYIIIFISTLIKNKRLALFMSAFGTLFCLRITYIEIFQLKVICPVCLACQIVMIIVLCLAWILYRKKSVPGSSTQ